MSARRRDDDDDDDDLLQTYGDDPRTFPHEGRGEEIDPAVDESEWVDVRGDQLNQASDPDDPVEAIERAALWAGTEAEASGDQTELADRAAPVAPEESALLSGGGASLDDDVLTVGLPAGSDVDDMTPEDLLEAELVAISEGDPELAAVLADELERRRKAE